MIRALALACAALACSAAWALPDDAAVRALLDERIAQKRAMGVAVVLVDARGTRIVAQGKVRADGPAVASDTLFEIGSLTKTFTGLLLADDVVRGTVALDDPVTKYLPAPGLSRDGRAVTLRDLATQSSGLPRLPSNLAPADRLDPYAGYDGARLSAFVAGYTLERTPGARYEYSNLGVGLLGYILGERDGGYAKAVRERIQAPLGMSDTAVDLSPAQRERFATGHTAKLEPTPPWTFDALAGAGGLRSTAADMAKYLRAAIDPASTPLAAAWKLATTPLADGPSSTTRIALAWHVLSRGGRTLVWHNGQTGGFASMMAFDPVSREGVVVLSNVSASVDDLALHLLDATIPIRPPPREHVAVKVDGAVLDRIAGRYMLAPNFDLVVRREGDRVYARATGQAEAEIFAESDYEYFYKAVDAQLSFHREGEGPVTGLVLHQGGRNVAGRKME